LLFSETYFKINIVSTHCWNITVFRKSLYIDDNKPFDREDFERVKKIQLLSMQKACEITIDSLLNIIITIYTV
jgi:hypothetical protein